MQNNPPSFEFLLNVFAKMPPLQLLFIILFAATWLIGGHILIAFHYHRLGKPWWSGLKPTFALPFKNFNAREWLVLLCLAVAALSFGMIALTLGSHGST